MGMAAILVMWPGPFEQTSVPHPKELSSIGPVVTENVFENVDRRTTTDTGVIGILIAHLKAFGSGELKTTNQWKWPMIDPPTISREQHFFEII